MDQKRRRTAERTELVEPAARAAQAAEAPAAKRRREGEPAERAAQAAEARSLGPVIFFWLSCWLKRGLLEGLPDGFSDGRRFETTDAEKPSRSAGFMAIAIFSEQSTRNPRRDHKTSLPPSRPSNRRLRASEAGL